MPRNKNLHISGTFKKSKKIKNFKNATNVKKRWTLIFRNEGVYECSNSYNKGNMHNQASLELSKKKNLSDIAYRNWNISAYSYDKDKNRFILKKELGKSADVPKYININKF